MQPLGGGARPSKATKCYRLFGWLRCNGTFSKIRSYRAI